MLNKGYKPRTFKNKTIAQASLRSEVLNWNEWGIEFRNWGVEYIGAKCDFEDESNSFWKFESSCDFFLMDAKRIKMVRTQQREQS